MAKLSSDEQRWRAQSDAHTMAEYEAIMGDSKRKAAAIKEAKTQAAELNKRAAAMQRAAGGPIERVTKSSRTAKKR